MDIVIKFDQKSQQSQIFGNGDTDHEETYSIIKQTPSLHFQRQMFFT